MNGICRFCEHEGRAGSCVALSFLHLSRGVVPPVYRGIFFTLADRKSLLESLSLLRGDAVQRVSINIVVGVDGPATLRIVGAAATSHCKHCSQRLR